jgi:CspA family cold shock protein
MSHPGKVKWFSDSKGYGFIEQSVGPDVYVHHASIQMDGYKTLKVGMKVEFELREGKIGSLEAVKVSPRR